MGGSPPGATTPTPTTPGRCSTLRPRRRPKSATEMYDRRLVGRGDGRAAVAARPSPLPCCDVGQDPVSVTVPRTSWVNSLPLIAAPICTSISYTPAAGAVAVRIAAPGSVPVLLGVVTLCSTVPSGAVRV